MRLTTSVLSVVVIAVFLCMIDKHVFGEEVECTTVCSEEYKPVCAQPTAREEFQTVRNQCGLDRLKKCEGDEAWLFINTGECTD
uniref:Salivary secreted kazaltype proteinase inhibitor n=1 Tax=Triatoma matogrossensis TaxID=162370 RepID=E2J793_9HEMI